MSSVLDHGADPTGAVDSTQAFSAALQSGHAFVPAGTYLVKSLNVPSDSVIECESRRSVVTGGGAGPIVHTTAFRRDVRIRGGTWRDCSEVWLHESNSSLSQCLFDEMAVVGAAYGWRLSSSVGNVWSGVRLAALANDPPVGSGWWLGLDGVANAVNANAWRDCRSLRFTGRCLVLADTEQPKRGNLIDNCWFEDSDAGAIYAGKGTEGLRIVGGYFETCGAPGAADVELAPAALPDKTVPTVSLSGATFARSNAGQTERVRLVGDCVASVTDCTAFLDDEEWFVRADAAMVSPPALSGNALRGGAGEYTEQ